MSSKEKLFKQMMQKKKSVTKDAVNETAVGLADVANVNNSSSDDKSQMFHETNNESELHAELHAENETFHESKSESIPQVITDVNNESVPELKQKQNHEVHTETQDESITKKQVEVNNESFPKPVVETIPETQKESQSQDESQVKVNVKTKTESESETINDPASILFDRIGTKKEYVEDQRIRRTYWLTKKEIKMVDELSKITGMDKYEVVTLAIQSMHARAMDMKKK